MKGSNCKIIWHLGEEVRCTKKKKKRSLNVSIKDRSKADEDEEVFALVPMKC